MEGIILSKIVNDKKKVILDDPDEFPEGALLEYLERKKINYVIYNDPFKYLKDVWAGSDLCAMSLSEFLENFPEVGKMNTNDCNELLVVFDREFVKVIPADMQDTSDEKACKFYSKILQEITGKKLYLTDTED